MRFRFTIRDLFWLVVVVALAVGWWLSNASSQKKLDVLHEAAEKWESAARVRTAELQRYINAQNGNPNAPVNDDPFAGEEERSVRTK